jgi:hypothetical protein
MSFRIVLIIFLFFIGIINIVYYISQQEAAAQQLTRVLTEPSRTGLQKSDGFISYKNSSFGITIQYPSTWMLNNTHLVSANYTYGVYHEIAEISPRFADIRPSFSISVISTKPNTTLDAYLGNTIQSYRVAFPNFTLSNMTNVTLAGNPGYWITYSFDSKPDKVLAIEIGTLIEHKVYQITYLADAKQYGIFFPNIKKMIHSLRININESDTKSAILKDLTQQEIAGM